MRKDYTIGLTVSENGLDDPDQQFYENFACGAARNYTGYCSAEVDQLIDRQSSEPDPKQRKEIVWQIEKSGPRTRRGRRSSIRSRQPVGSLISRATR